MLLASAFGMCGSGTVLGALVPGTDSAGIVAAKGRRVRRFDIGDRVYAYAYGFYAEQVAVDAEDVGREPKVLDPLHVGAAVTTGLTALQGIDDALCVHAGDTALIFLGRPVRWERLPFNSRSVERRVC
jgi:NADPH:quinone reductase-like Zn-dependent oxidoreductase